MSYQLQIRDNCSKLRIRGMVHEYNIVFESKDHPGYEEVFINIGIENDGHFLMQGSSPYFRSVCCSGFPSKKTLKHLAYLIELSGGRLFDGRERIRGLKKEKDLSI